MLQRLKRLLPALALALVLLISTTEPATAQASGESAWMELLEYSTVNNAGKNWFQYSSNVTVSIPTPYSMRLTKIDLLITYPENTAPTKVDVFYNGTYYELEMRRIDATTSRVFGTIQNNFYSDVRVRFTRASTAISYLEILSCRVSQIVSQEVEATAQVFVDDTYYPTSYNIEVVGDPNPIFENMNSDSTIRIDVQDWMKFDKLSIWGSADCLAVTSIRVNVGKLGVPFEVSYRNTLTNSEWSEWYNDSSGWSGVTITSPSYLGKSLYCITIDVSELDPTYNFGGNSYPMYIYITGNFRRDVGYDFNCQYVNGTITVPDKTAASWWTRFTDFMTGLFNRDSAESDAFADDMQQMGDSFQDALDQMDEVTQPPVEDLPLDPSAYLDPNAIGQAGTVISELFNNKLVTPMVCITLTVGLAAFIIF